MAHNPESSQSNANRIPGASWLELFVQQVDLNSASVTADDAPLIQRALQRAQALRLIEANPGDAYLQGVTDALGFRDLQDIVREYADTDLTPPSEAA